MARQPRLFGIPVMRIISTTTGETVGYVYEWCNGELQPFWIDQPVRSVTYAPMTTAA